MVLVVTVESNVEKANAAVLEALALRESTRERESQLQQLLAQVMCVKTKFTVGCVEKSE